MVDENGDAVIGANVLLLETRQGVSVFNVDGSFVILGVVPGIYTVKVSCIGYETQEINDVVVSIDRTTTLNSILAQIPIQGNEVEIVLRGKGKGTIEGQVVDENGVGISGAEVLVHTYSGLVHIRAEDPQKVFTDANGNFISFAYSGTCTIEIKCLGYTMQKIRDIEIHTGDTTTVNVKLIKELRQSEAQIKGISTGKIAGTVVDKNGDGVIGATVQLPESRQGVMVYDLDGRYVVLGVAPGNYTVNVKSIGYKTQIFDSIIVKPDFTTTINVTLMEEKIDPSEESYTTRCRPYTILGTQPGFKVSPDSGPCGPRAGYRASADGEIQMSNVAASRRFVRLDKVHSVKPISQKNICRLRVD